MNDKNTNNIDQISSDDNEEFDNGGAYYEIQDNDEDKEKKSRKPGFIKLFIKLLISPRVGWRDIRRAHLTGEETCRGLFYPFIALASIVNFANLLYVPEKTVSGELINAVITFASFFFSYFLIFPFSGLLLKGKSSETMRTEFGKSFVAFAMSTLCLFYILYVLLPMLEPILLLIPLWTIFIITRGIKILRIPSEEDTRATIWLSLLIVGLPVGLAYLFILILP